MRKYAENEWYKDIDWAKTGGLTAGGGLAGFLFNRYLLGNKSWTSNVLSSIIGASLLGGGSAAYDYFAGSPTAKELAKKTKKERAVKSQDEQVDERIAEEAKKEAERGTAATERSADWTDKVVGLAGEYIPSVAETLNRPAVKGNELTADKKRDLGEKVIAEAPDPVFGIKYNNPTTRIGAAAAKSGGIGYVSGKVIEAGGKKALDAIAKSHPQEVILNTTGRRIPLVKGISPLSGRTIFTLNLDGVKKLKPIEVAELYNRAAKSQGLDMSPALKDAMRIMNARALGTLPKLKTGFWRSLWNLTKGTGARVVRHASRIGGYSGAIAGALSQLGEELQRSDEMNAFKKSRQSLINSGK